MVPRGRSGRVQCRQFGCSVDKLGTSKHLGAPELPICFVQDQFEVGIRGVDGGLLIQDRDPVSVDRSAWRVVSRRQPTEAEWRDLELGWVVVASVSSNAIVITHDEQAVGIGAGQQNRLDSARIAVEKAADRAPGGVASSDAFFPFRDGLDALAASGVTAAIEPGGSMRDADVIAAADEHDMALVFTDERHFRH